MALMAAGCGTSGPGGRDAPVTPSTQATPITPVTPTDPAASARPPGSAEPARPIPVTALPGWRADDVRGVERALARQCALRAPPAPWPRLCEEAAQLQGDRLKDWVQRRFVARPVTGADGAVDGLITGYHEPMLTGSRTRRHDAQEPIYRRPSPEVLARRPTRAELEGDRPLAGSELAWIDDPVEAFFLHIQGSGRIRLPDGALLRVGFAADNGQPYTAIGATLRARGALPEAELNAGTIKAWLRAHPDQARAVMQTNARFIFFRELPAGAPDDGPPGSLNVPLTPGRSIAVDPRFVPRGALLWMATTHPRDGAPLQRLVLAQDTGAAITGAVRADLFWGDGPDAETYAGLMKQRGRLWLLVPSEAGN